MRGSSLWGNETCEGCKGRERSGRRGRRRTRAAVSSKRGPKTTGWLGKNQVGSKARDKPFSNMYTT
eukprot:1041527-Pyramimonas_sp.AAC.1